MMKSTYSYFSGYHICFTFLQVIVASASTSQNLMVTTPTRHLVARVGGQAELSCQVSPPRSVEYMEVRWFRSDNSKLVYQYGGGHGVNGEAAPEYVNRTEFVKEAIGKGKVALRIHNISISDDGLYQCSFNDSGFSDMTSMNLSVAAFGLKMQIHVESPGDDGFIVVCLSEGWFPQPRMEWRDSQGEVVPYSSISHSQDEDRFFHTKMTLLLRNQSQESITCCVLNPLTGEEKQTNLILANALFDENCMKKIIFCFFTTSIVLSLFYLLTFIFKKQDCESTCAPCFHKLDIPVMALQFLCFIAFSITILLKYLQLRNKVSISDPLFSVYNGWMANMANVVGAVMGVRERPNTEDSPFSTALNPLPTDLP
ncbi:selection and upkeep of intraepithelial T-cells protein 8-like isoform X2 [Peromyscus leucopus]|uniref:selection and upkeep of intraepithelial T-cells protein 8-like isoform X2 n=1 Tax=Peromyscus leucopus TaxID=10041 RepID=UPI001884E4AA|nr:selection and upkeep of intraepithelial T-cells protein 8-like isoform X2 [Peromyscus leucopus]